MDDLDQKLLAALTADSSTSTARLGRRFKVARSTVQARIERMEREGVIAGYTIRPGQAAAMRRIRATVLLGVTPRAMAATIQALRSIPEVEALHTTTGRVSLILRLAAAIPEELDAAIDRIGALEGVEDSESLIHLSTRFDRST